MIIVFKRADEDSRTCLFNKPAGVTLALRPRLLARLADGLTRPLTLISAPTGFGKTTLLGEWRNTDNGRGALLNTMLHLQIAAY